MLQRVRDIALTVASVLFSILAAFIIYGVLSLPGLIDSLQDPDPAIQAPANPVPDFPSETPEYPTPSEEVGE